MENQVQVMHTIGQIADEKIKLVVDTGSTLKKDFNKQMTIKAALRLRNRIFNTKAVVIEEFPYDLLLGNDFLSTEKAIIDFSKGMLEIQTVSVLW